MTTTRNPNPNPQANGTTEAPNSPATANPHSNDDRPASANPTSELIGRFTTYAAAENAIDRLSDGGFPVEHATIVGDELRSVEYVTGRRTTATAALSGATQGTWMGLTLFFLFAVITPWAFGALILALTLPVAVGAAFAAAEHALRGGRRDFESIRRIEAGSYAVMVTAGWAEAARATLAAR